MPSAFHDGGIKTLSVHPAVKWVPDSNEELSLLYAVPLIQRASNSPLPPGRVAQSVGHLTRKSGVVGSIPGLATYFRFSFRFFKKGSCQLLAKVCARSTG